MKSILALSLHPDFVKAVRASLPDDAYRIVHPGGVDEAEPVLVHGLVSACVLDGDLAGVETIWAVQRIRRYNKSVPIIVYTEFKQAGWEEEAILNGVSQILAKPVRPQLLNSILERLWAAPAPPCKHFHVLPRTVARRCRHSIQNEENAQIAQIETSEKGCLSC